MAKKDESTGETEPQPNIKALLVEALKGLSHDELREILGSAGAIPTTMGMSPETMRVIMSSMQATSAEGMRQALRSQRKENPAYPERSVFHPEGVYDDDGTPKPGKVKLRVPTKYCGVRLGGELEDEDEIKLLNSFTESKTAREGLWTAEVVNPGTIRERLIIDLPSKTQDERNSLPSMKLALRELLSGAAAVNTESMFKQLEEMKARIAELEGKQTVGAPA